MLTIIIISLFSAILFGLIDASFLLVIDKNLDKPLEKISFFR